MRTLALDSLFDEVESRVREQQEQDEWEALAKEHFPLLCEELFSKVETLLKPLQSRLAKYADASIERVWSLTRVENSLKVSFAGHELEFRPIGIEAKQRGDRFTVQILRKNEDLVGRYAPITTGTVEMQLGVLGHSAVTENLDDRHLIQLLLAELME
ncbi:hypothetical protein [Alicyclobacillus dauci]|uniref:Uncharacterized protein n=1 Tax=Alicyclobacillus dauci TaxID=1475485 RepID=A0ABY6YZS6_9BACL|nr:hypothetical protein [Alicyclobacillus dauci]WAH35964.1 hypothetical protein NZD86_17085 [Alicyclobacillus dauci]